MGSIPPPAGPIKPRSRAQVFSALISDGRLSHGAFRLWHALYDHMNSRTGQCNPGQRRLADMIGCDVHSLKRWTGELIDAGWIVVEAQKWGGPKAWRRGESFRYTMLDGQGELLRKTTSPSDGENHITRRRCEKPHHSVVEKHIGVCGKPTSKLSGGIKPPHPEEDSNGFKPSPPPEGAVASQDGNAPTAQPSAGDSGKEDSCLGKF